MGISVELVQPTVGVASPKGKRPGKQNGTRVIRTIPSMLTLAVQKAKDLSHQNNAGLFVIITMNEGQTYPLIGGNPKSGSVRAVSCKSLSNGVTKNMTLKP